MASHEAAQASSGKKPSKVRQACDCCHARKIRCDGLQPCVNCSSTSLPCTYLAIPKKKGPKGPSSRTPRAVLKMQMRQQRVPLPPTATTITASIIEAKTSPPVLDTAHNIERQLQLPLQELQLAHLTHGFRPSPLLTLVLAEQHVDSFFKHKYPVFPILHRERFYALLHDFHNSPETYSLVAALCAAVISQTQPDANSVSSPQSSMLDPTSQPDFYVNEVKRARTYYDYIEKPTLQDAQTSFFLFASLFNADRHNSAWFVLREAMTMLQILRLHEEETYQNFEDPLDALYARRTFWLMFLTERAYALQRHRPLTLQRTIDLPRIAPNDPEQPIISGFFDLISLFQSIDDSFVALWNVTTSTDSLPFTDEDAANVSARQLSALQEMLAVSIPDVKKRTEVQQADLQISRQWLKTMVWQLCVTKGLLSSASADESMSFTYPVKIARDLVKVSTSLNREAFEPHGQGILEKVFDVGCSLADVLQLHGDSPAFATPGIEFGPKDYLKEMLRLMQTVFGGNSKYLYMLANKADECFHYGPRAALEFYSNQDTVEGNPDGHDNNNGSNRIVELADDSEYAAHSEGPYAGFNGSTPGDMYRYSDHDHQSDQQMFDFGSLSEASMAWLGSMDIESDFSTPMTELSGMDLPPVDVAYLPPQQHG